MRRCIAANLSFLPNPTRKTLAKLFLVCVLCVLSYLLGIYLNSRPDLPTSGPALLSQDSKSVDCLRSRPNLTVVHTSSSSSQLDFEPHHLLPLPPGQDPATDAPAAGGHEPPRPMVPFCPDNFTDYCPCQDPNRERFFPVENMSHRERHCPGTSERARCRVPRPKGYRTPFPWPESRDRAWFANVPSKRLVTAKADQNWVKVVGDTLVFPGGGTSFPSGVKGYVADMAKLLPFKTGEIRTALDIGCGVASFGGHLLDYNMLTLSVAPRDVHEAQVQFALERGLPAMLGVLSTHRLPYPARSFDMAHCARCLIHWDGYGGLFLLEIDRLLRPGGYWVLSGPPINWRHFYKGWRRTAQDLEAEQKSIENVAKRLCWKKVKEKGIFAVWRKPFNHVTCTTKSKILNSFPVCNSNNPDAAWYEKMESCLTPLPKAGVNDIAGGATERWPKRLNAIPPRILTSSIMGVTSESFNEDNRKWIKRLSYYESALHLTSFRKYRNVMDMNAELGGFAAALNKYPVWVMNVIPVDSSMNNTLGVVYERGLIGTYMNWCEAFSTYPRTYDLVHANGIFRLYMDKCDVLDILLEVDRILRPQGAVIIRDHVDFVVKAKRASDQLGWQSRIVHSEKGDFDPEKLLIVDNSVNLHQPKAGRR